MAVIVWKVPFFQTMYFPKRVHSDKEVEDKFVGQNIMMVRCVVSKHPLARKIEIICQELQLSNVWIYLLQAAKVKNTETFRVQLNNFYLAVHGVSF